MERPLIIARLLEMLKKSLIAPLLRNTIHYAKSNFRDSTMQ
jgi:hypothetical protein